MPPIFKTTDGLPLACFVDPSCKERASVLKAIRVNGGGVSARDTDADIVLVDAEEPPSRQRARDLCRTSIVLFVEWVDACVSAGRLLGQDHRWGSLRIEDPGIVDESLYTDDTPPVKEQLAQTKLEDDVKAIVPASSRTPITSRGFSELPVPLGAPSHTKAGSPHVTFGITTPLSDHTNDIVGRNSKEPVSLTPQFAPPYSPDEPNSLPFGKAPEEPHLAALFASAHEEWRKLRQDSVVSSNHVGHLRTGSYDPLDTISTPGRISDPLARRRTSRDGSSSDHSAKRRKLSGPQRGIRSKVPSVIVPAPGALVYSRSVDDLPNTSTASRVMNSSVSAPQTPNGLSEPIFTALGIPIRFWIQVDLPDRGSIIRLIKKHGGQVAPAVEDATYAIASKSMPQYQEIVSLASEAGKIAVPVAWLHECVKQNAIVTTGNFAISLPRARTDSAQPTQPAQPSSDHGILTDSEIIAAARNPFPPAPITATRTFPQGQNRFTEEDRTFLCRFLAWKTYRSPAFSNGTFVKELSERATTHPHSSWQSFFYRCSDEVDRVRKIVRGLRQGS